MRPRVVALLRRLQGVRYWLEAQVAMAIFGLLRMLPPHRALDFADRFARRVGPWFGRHRTALGNLRAAYPEKTEAEIQAIASDMWGNMARLAAEYIFLDFLLTRRPGQLLPDAVEVVGADIFERLLEETGRPHVIFSGHIGNFELLPIAAGLYGLPITVMFRPPNNPYIAAYIQKKRAAMSGGLLPSNSGAAFKLAQVLDADGNVGVLVDQKFDRGVRSTFFGRPCDTNPLVPKLARQFDCDVYPAHVVRLPGNRFRIELEDRLDLPRTEAGAVDVNATAQLLNDVVERWVRAEPGQWMWFHKRWSLSPFARGIKK